MDWIRGLLPQHQTSGQISKRGLPISISSSGSKQERRKQPTWVCGWRPYSKDAISTHPCYSSAQCCTYQHIAATCSSISGSPHQTRTTRFRNTENLCLRSVARLRHGWPVAWHCHLLAHGRHELKMCMTPCRARQPKYSGTSQCLFRISIA